MTLRTNYAGNSSTLTMKTPKEIKGKETKLGKEMVREGYPYCYRIKGVDKHCETCIKNYKLRIKREKLMGITSP